MSVTKVTNTGAVSHTDGAVATPSITNTGDLNTGVYFPAADTVGVVTGGTERFRFGSNPIPGGSKNMIHNGAMMVNQRGSTSISGGTTVQSLDRFALTFYDASATDAAATITRDSDSPDGFGQSMKIDCTTIATGGGDYNYVYQRIEAQNLQHLKYGSSDALTCTFSFWFKSTVTGIYSAYFYHIDATYTFVREFTVASSDTWEFFQVTLPGYTSTNFGNDTGAGLEIGITLAATHAQAASNNTWQTGGDAGGSTNQVNGLSSTSNNIYTTGWQFEVGDVATDFEHLDYATALNHCFRYFVHTGVGTMGAALSTSQAFFGFQYPVQMRAAPTAALVDTTMYVLDSGGGGLVGAPNAIYGSTLNKTGCYLAINGWSGGNALTQHRPLVIYNYGTDPISFSAEL